MWAYDAGAMIALTEAIRAKVGEVEDRVNEVNEVIRAVGVGDNRVGVPSGVCMPLSYGDRVPYGARVNVASLGGGNGVIPDAAMLAVNSGGIGAQNGSLFSLSALLRGARLGFKSR